MLIFSDDRTGSIEMSLDAIYGSVLFSCSFYYAKAKFDPTTLEGLLHVYINVTLSSFRKRMMNVDRATRLKKRK